MQISISFTRVLFIALCILFIGSYTAGTLTDQSYLIRLLIGAIAGIAIGTLVICLDPLFKKFNLRAFNIAVLGLFFGYFMGEAVLLTFQQMLSITNLEMHPQVVGAIRLCILRVTIYLGMVMTIRASDELYVSIPFIKFKPASKRKKISSYRLFRPYRFSIDRLGYFGLLRSPFSRPRFRP